MLNPYYTVGLAATETVTVLVAPVRLFTIVNCVVRSTVNSLAVKLKLNPCTTTAFADVGWFTLKNGTVVPAANGCVVVKVATFPS